MKRAAKIFVLVLVAAVAGAAFVNRTYLLQRVVSPEDRLKQARRNGTPKLKAKLMEVKLSYPAKEIYLRAFKQEKTLELWATNKPGEPLTRVTAYTIAKMSGDIGPKRKEGDRQVPEGFYVIDRFNPRSGFWLSLGLNYPNASDRILSDKQRPGGDIFIHGSNKSIGCLAMTDPIIEEIYLAALDARTGGQKTIRVDIFPSRWPDRLSTRDPNTQQLWEILARSLAQFEKTRRPVPFTVSVKGEYEIPPDR